jgi:tRNA (adenine22-N1)-methyltransferase
MLKFGNRKDVKIMNLRLQELAQMVRPGARIADIGTDHAYLPIQLVKTGKIDFAIASDIAAGPLANAKKDLEQAHLTQQVELRLGPGLTTVTPEDQIDTVVIAGMGGKLICQILTAAAERQHFYQHLVLEANIGEMQVRKWLVAHNYRIEAEKLIFTAGHSYELIAASRCQQKQELTLPELFFGPLILKQQRTSQVFINKWQRQLTYYQKLLNNLQLAKQPDAKQIAAVKKWIQLIEGALHDQSN